MCLSGSLNGKFTLTEKIRGQRKRKNVSGSKVNMAKAKM